MAVERWDPEAIQRDSFGIKLAHEVIEGNTHGLTTVARRIRRAWREEATQYDCPGNHHLKAYAAYNAAVAHCNAWDVWGLQGSQPALVITTLSKTTLTTLYKRGNGTQTYEIKPTGTDRLRNVLEYGPVALTHRLKGPLDPFK